jgi:hypothetical protein
VHRVIYEELVLGVVREESRQAYREVVDRLVARGAQGVILGCTEIELLIGPDDVDVPTFPTTALHVAAAVRTALEDRVRHRAGRERGLLLARSWSGRHPDHRGAAAEPVRERRRQHGFQLAPGTDAAAALGGTVVVHDRAFAQSVGADEAAGAAQPTPHLEVAWSAATLTA